MTENGRLCVIPSDASRGAGSLAPFSYYYGYFSARAETV